MKLNEFLDYMNSGLNVEGGSEVHKYMVELSQEAMKITCELNNCYHDPEEIRKLFSKLIGKKVDTSFAMFPPFYTDCGKNIVVGKMYLLTQGADFKIKGEFVSEMVH